MSKGFGKIQRAIAAMIKANPDGAWAYEHLAERIYETAPFTRAAKERNRPRARKHAASRDMGRAAGQLQQ